MGTIKELSPLLTNQIAAGEVIERPSSVVKELLENAIDAGSTRIEIEIEESGLRKIRIQDNGSGMTKEDARMSIKRHTTSKLYSPEQLFRIHTLGFRGEALASITAVSKVTLTTSTGEDSGVELKIESGEIKEEKTVPPLKGTTFLVEDLFYNTPARLKFVRTLQTELAHITDVVSKASLSHPEIAFILKNDGNLLLQTSGKGELLQAVAGNIGPVNARKMLPFSGEDEDFKVSGYTSLPELTSRTPELSADQADQLAAIAAGIQSLSHGASVEFGDGSGGVRSAMTEFYGGVLFIVEAGEGAHLAVVTTEDADAGLVGHNMSELVEQLGEHLTARPRTS